MKNKTVFVEILNFIKTVEVCNTNRSLWVDGDDCPICMIGSARRGGINLDKELAYRNGFANYFGVTEQEAGEVLFPKTDEIFICSGEDYYKAGKKLLIKYGYADADLFETAQSFDEIMEHLKMAVSVEY